MRRDAIYARQSVDREDSLSIEGQLARCRFEAGEGAQEYVDRGFSGKDTNRPAFRRMMEAVHAGRIGRVIVYRLDRISRSILDFARMMEVFEARDVEFLSATEHFDTAQPMGRAMLNICIVFAQLERETIQARVLDTYADRSRQGFYMGGRIPFGFTLCAFQRSGIHTACYAPVPAEAAAVRRMYALYAAEGMTLGETARQLQSEGIFRRSGQEWTASRLRELLKNPIYCRADAQVLSFFRAQGTEPVNAEVDFIGRNGCYLFRGKSADKRTDLRGACLVLAPHEGLVDSGVWLICRRKLMSGSRSGSGRRGQSSWLCGIVRCAACMRALSVARSKSSAGRYFVCPGKRRNCAGLPTIYADALESTVERVLARKISLVLNSETDGLEALRARERQYTQELDQLAECALHTEGALLRALERRARQIEMRLEEIRRADAAAESEECRRFAGLSAEKKRQILHALVEKISMEAGRMTVYWRF